MIRDTRYTEPQPALAAGQIGVTMLESWDTFPGAQHPSLVARAVLNVRTGRWTVEPLPHADKSALGVLPAWTWQQDGIHLAATTEDGARLALRTITVTLLWLVQQREDLVAQATDRLQEAMERGDQAAFDLS